MGRIVIEVCLFGIVGLLLLSGCGERGDGFPVLTGPYLGQPQSSEGAALFAPGIVSNGMTNRDVAMMPDGTEIYFGMVVGNNAAMAVMETRLVGGRWTRPEVADFCTDARYKNLEPAISPDGQRFFFVSNRPDEKSGEAEPGNWDIWVMDRTGDGWGEPYNLGPPVNSEEGEFFPSVTRDGTLYFTRGSRINHIYRSRLMDGKYTEPERLGPRVNCGRTQFNAFVAPDESYVIVPVFGREDSFGGTDYYIVYRDDDDRWSEPVHLGAAINSPSGREWSPYVSPDGKFFFFMSDRMEEGVLNAGSQLSYRLIRKMYGEPQNGNPNIYWVSASFVDELRPDGF